MIYAASGWESMGQSSDKAGLLLGFALSALDVGDNDRAAASSDRTFVASIDTCLKYSEAISQVAPVSFGCVLIVAAWVPLTGKEPWLIYGFRYSPEGQEIVARELLPPALGGCSETRGNLRRCELVHW
jgi:hypothetical protein